MSRQLFLHQSVPALYFSALSCCSAFPPSYPAANFCGVHACIQSFSHLSPLFYGSPWTKVKCNDTKWLITWDFSCSDFRCESWSIWRGARFALDVVRMEVETFQV